MARMQAWVVQYSLPNHPGWMGEDVVVLPEGSSIWEAERVLRNHVHPAADFKSASTAGVYTPQGPLSFSGEGDSVDKVYRVYCQTTISAPSRLVVVDVMAPSAQKARVAVFEIAPSFLVSGVADAELSKEPPRGVEYLNVACCQQRAEAQAGASAKPPFKAPVVRERSFATVYEVYEGLNVLSDMLMAEGRTDDAVKVTTVMALVSQKIDKP